MWIALIIIIAVVAFIVAVAGYQYVRPPRGPAVDRHELTPFEAQASAEQQSKTSGTMSGGGPTGWKSSGGSSWKEKSSED